MAFGTEQIKKETPLWAKRMFRIVFLFTTVATLFTASNPQLGADTKVIVSVYLKCFEMAVFGLSKMFGVNPKTDDEGSFLTDSDSSANSPAQTPEENGKP